jgi:hypothetical protein
MQKFPGSVLVLSNATDPLGGAQVQVAHGIFATYPNAEYFEHPNCGHDLCRDDPDWVSEKVKTFLFRTAPRYDRAA